MKHRHSVASHNGLDMACSGYEEDDDDCDTP